MDRTAAEPVANGALTHVFVGLAWLAATTYATHATITGSGTTGSEALDAAVAALPGVVAAMLVTGAALGATAARRKRSAAGRLIAGIAVGAVFAVAAAAGLRLAYGGEASGGEPFTKGLDGNDSVTMLTLIVGAASIVGAALTVLPRAVLKAGLWAATWVFVAGVAFGVVEGLVGKGGSEAFIVGQTLATGLVAGFFASRFLRVERHRVLWSVACGALPGTALLIAAWLTRAGGSTVVTLVHGNGAEPPAPIGPFDSGRLSHAVIVLAVGGLFAMLLTARRHRRQEPTPQQPNLDTFHRDLARIGLDAGEPYGFALAGGYAVQAAGLLHRPTEDIDLFTPWERRADFGAATQAIIDAYRSTGLNVRAERRHDTFIRLTVSDGVQRAKVELGVDPRAKPPVRTPIGLVLHPDDAVANKMRAVYERSHACDFIDIDAALQSGRYDRSTLLRLAQDSDITFDRRAFADALAKAQHLDSAEFARYGVAGENLDALRHSFTSWRAELLTAGSAR